MDRGQKSLETSLLRVQVRGGGRIKQPLMQSVVAS